MSDKFVNFTRFIGVRHGCPVTPQVYTIDTTFLRYGIDFKEGIFLILHHLLYAVVHHKTINHTNLSFFLK